MKILLLMLLVSCVGGGAGGSDSSSEDVVSNNPIVITYNSYGSYQITGVSLDLMGTFGEQEPLIIPQFLDVLQDTNNSLQNNDVARIKFVDTVCVYTYNGTQFEFDSCSGLLSAASFGDTIYLHDLHNPLNAQRDGKIDFGVVRPGGSNHTGTIEITTTL